MRRSVSVRTWMGIGIAWALAGQQQVFAQLLDSSARSFSLQARLESAGIPADGVVDLEVRIYDAEGAPTPIGGPYMVNGVEIVDHVISTMIPGLAPTDFDGGARWMGITVTGAGPELTPRVPLSAAPYALRVDRVSSAELDDNLVLGSTSSAGSLMVHGNIESFAAFRQRDSIGGPVLGTMYRFDGHGQMDLYDADGDRIVAMGNTSFFNGVGGQLHLYRGEPNSFNPQAGASLIGNENNAGALYLRANHCDQFCQTATTVALRAFNDNEGAELRLSNHEGTETVVLTADTGNPHGALLQTFNADGDAALLIGTGALGDGAVEVLQDDGSRGVAITGDHPSIGGGGRLRLWDEDVLETVDLRANYSGPGTGAWMALRADGAEGVTFAARAASNGRGGLIEVKNDAAQATVRIIGDTGNGRGRIITPILQITGGSDLAESFDINGAAEPGMVMVIDPQSPGRLKPSHGAYDRAVAGVVSGAGGVQTGMVMGQPGTLADGASQVALTGRVYCWADAGPGAIRPGDLLTTAHTPGHAMKAADPQRAAGAILGKAMTGLEHGRGLVLVLVSLQ